MRVHRRWTMIEIKRRLKSATDREKWAARGATFVAKARATKVVWFPPHPTEAGTKAASTAKKATKRATKKATKKPARKPARKTATKTAKKTTGAAKKATGGTG
jgi:K+-sensing histidine kinase KdpD